MPQSKTHGKICYVELPTIGGDAPEITARFRDPGGNVIGLYQEPAQAT